MMATLTNAERIERLERDVEQLKVRDAERERDIEESEDRVLTAFAELKTDLTGRMDALESRMDALESRMAAVETTLSQIVETLSLITAKMGIVHYPAEPS